MNTQILDIETELTPGIMPWSSAIDLITAGNCTFTIKGRESRFTYKFSKAENKDDFYFVSLLTGSNNNDDFCYIGTFGKSFGYKHGVKSRINHEAVSIKALEYTLSFILTKIPHPQIQIWHEGKCCRCGRKLTDPDSISIGLGPYCQTK